MGQFSRKMLFATQLKECSEFRPVCAFMLQHFALCYHKKLIEPISFAFLTDLETVEADHSKLELVLQRISFLAALLVVSRFVQISNSTSSLADGTHSAMYWMCLFLLLGVRLLTIIESNSTLSLDSWNCCLIMWSFCFWLPDFLLLLHCVLGKSLSLRVHFINFTLLLLCVCVAIVCSSPVALLGLSLTVYFLSFVYPYYLFIRTKLKYSRLKLLYLEIYISR